jgi:hypothetical protein
VSGLDCIGRLTAGDGISLFTASDGSRVELFHRSARLACSDGELAVVLIAVEDLPAPEALAGENVVAALARLSATYRYPDALLWLPEPAQALGADRMAHAEGARLVSIDTADDEACWDAALSKGLPIYGLRGEIVASVRRATSIDLLGALAYGLFHCREGLVATVITEERSGVSWEIPAAESVQVILRDGFEAASIPGPSGSWTDRGDEAVVRLVASGSEGRLWTQPRFIMPLPPGGGP